MLAKFRDLKVRPPLPALEKAMLIVVGAHLSFLPWAFGGMRAGSQIVSLVLALMGLVLALWPRGKPVAWESSSLTQREGPSGWTQLKRFPIFWLGCALFGYISVQALNPSWHYVRQIDRWWMEPVDHFAWLPTGAETPFAQANAWRSLIIFGSVWAVICTLWIGLTRRSSARYLVVALVVNAAALAFVALLQRVAGNGKILWLIPAPTDYFVATILYKNHAGAYFNLLLAASSAVGLWYWRQPERTTPAPLFGFCTALLAFAVVLSFSRAALLLMLIFGGLVGFAASVRSLRHKSWRQSLVTLSIVLVLLTGFLFTGLRYLRIGEAADRMQRLFTTDRFSAIDARATVARATWEMARDHLVTGWGAGSYRFVFPLYQQRYPKIYMYPWEKDRMYYWEHAHNDYLEFLAELGLIGSSLPATGVFLWGAYLFRRKVWKNAPLALLSGGVLVLLAHCWVDFNLQCPAIFITAAALATITARWLQLERPASVATG